MRWVLQHKTAIGIVLGLIVLVVASIWFWGVLVGYVEPKGPTGRKDIVQVFALIVAGVVGLIGAIVGIANLSVSRRNLAQQLQLEEQRRQSTLELEDQRRQSTLELEDQRTQEAALQAYFEQMGNLLTEYNLISTEREDIRQLARSQTLTVLARLDGARKGSLVRFLHGAGLVHVHKAIVHLNLADLRGADLSHADLSETGLRRTFLTGASLTGAFLAEADLSETDLSGANFSGADLSRALLNGANLSEALLRWADLSGANLREANLSEANLSYANLGGADFRDANLERATILSRSQLTQAGHLAGATMPNGRKYEDWI
jgi:uncharacterized protein YjbI with pentapeptide repeats